MNKTLTCIASLAPIVGVVFGFGGMMIIAFMLEDAETAGALLSVGSMMFSFILIFIGVIMCWVDIFWFIALTCKRKDWDTSKKVIWSIVLYMLNIFVFPVYWYLYLRTED